MAELLDPSKTEMQPLFPNRESQLTAKQDLTGDSKKYAQMSESQLVDSEIAATVVNRFKSSMEWRMQKRLVWDKCWQHYKGVYDKTNKASWQTTTFQPATSKVVETIVANMHAAMMGPLVPIEYQSRRSDFDDEVRSINEIIQSDLDKCDFKAHWTDFLRTLTICGTAVGKVDYVKESETIMLKERVPETPMDGMLRQMGASIPQEVIKPTYMQVKDNARIKNVDIYDIYPQPRITEITKDTWIIEKGKITNRELIQGMQDQDPYYKLDNVTEDLLNGTGIKSVDQDPEKQVRRMALMDYAYPQYYLDTDREHELLEYWGLIPLWWLKPELRKDPVRMYESVPGWIWVVDGQYVVRKRVSPWRDAEPPYFKGNYIRIPGEFYGIGVAEIMMGLQIEKNEIRNSRMDNINLMLNKIVGVIKEHVFDWDRFKSEPGQLWIFKGIDDIRKAMMPIEFPDITKDSWTASAEVDREIQESTGANKATIGAGGASDEAGGGTFRGQLLNKQASAERFMLYARVLEVMGLSKAIRKFYDRIYQFKSFQDAIDILGEARAMKFKFLAPEELERGAKLVPLGVMTSENEGVKLAQMEAFAEQWKAFPFFKQLEMARRMWLQMGFPEPDTVLFSDEEMATYNKAKKELVMQGINPGMPGEAMSQGNVGQGPEIAGNSSTPMQGLPEPAKPAPGPGSSPIDGFGRPIS